MNNNMHDQLNKLRLISKLKEGQSLETKNGLSVYEFTLTNWLRRKWYSDNKEEVTRFLQEFYKSIEQLAEELIGNIRSAKDETKRCNLLYVAINLAEKIKSSLNGIEMLSRTYARYPETTSTLEGIVQDFAIRTYKQLLEIIPVERTTKELKESVSYTGVLLHVGMANDSDMVE